MTDADLLDGWGAWMTLSGLAENTVRVRLSHLRLFARNHGPLDRATRTDVARWLGRYRGPVSRSTYASYLRTFYDWANAEGYITDNPTDRLPKMKMPRKAPRPIPSDDLARALSIAPERERFWLELMAYAGLRCCEVAVHRAANFWQDGDGSWWLRVPLSKGGHDQQIPVPAWLGDKGRTFPDWRPLSPQSVQRPCSKILRSVGSTSTPHALRHFYATSILASTQNLRLTQVLMRHADPSTTARYAAVADRDAVAAVQGLRRVG